MATCGISFAEDGTSPDAATVTKIKDLDGHFPFKPPVSKEEWEKRAEQVRTQLKVAVGIHPMPQLPPLKPSVHGKRDLDGYSVEKVSLESLPGLYITGTLYRPTKKSADGKYPAMLVAHGHWTDARFYDAKPDEIKRLLATGEERFENAARNHLQAKCVQLARMGCIVFQYDMLGNADSQQISLQRAHGFKGRAAGEETTADGWVLFSPEAEGYSQSIMGIQTIHSIRSLDYLTSLPEVDTKRLGITGASGGGTQSFIAAAVDPRLTLSFPAVMVSTGMQGGCTCENASLLRVDTGNIEIAALFAPRPQGMTAADDWTRTMAKDGFPELKQLYGLYGAADKVALFPSLHFGHNYNHVARVSLYGWVNKHFSLGGSEPVLEKDFEYLDKKDLTVWDDKHPMPSGGLNLERKILSWWSDDARKQILAGSDQDTLKILKQGWDTILAPVHTLSSPLTVREGSIYSGDTAMAKANTKGNSEGTIYIAVGPVSENTKKELASKGAGATVVDFEFLGENPSEPQRLVANPRRSAAYTFGYNAPRLVRRAAVLSRYLQEITKDSSKKIILVGEDENAFVAAAAAYSSPKNIELVRIQPNAFQLSNAKDIDDPIFVPASLRYFSLTGLVASTQDVKFEWIQDNKNVSADYKALQEKKLLSHVK